MYTDSENLKQRRGTTSTFGGIANFANLIIGAGFIALPASVCRLGVIISFVMLIFSYFIATRSVSKIIEAKIFTSSSAYEEICEKLLGPIGYWMLNVSLWVFLFCNMWVYFVIATSFQLNGLWQLIADVNNDSAQMFGTLIISAIIIPLGFLRELGFLRFTSLLGVICVIIFVVCSIVGVAQDRQNQDDFLNIMAKKLNKKEVTTPQLSWDVPMESDLMTALRAMGAIFCAFTCHEGVCSIHESLRDKNAWKKISVVGFGIAFVCNLTMAYSIYFLYYGFTCADGSGGLFTALFDKDESGAGYVWNTIGATAMSISVISTIPLTHFFLRELSWSIFAHTKGWTRTTPMPNCFFYGHLVIWASGTVLAIFAPKAIRIIDFVGNFSSVMLMIILPVLLDYQMCHGIPYYISFGVFPKQKSLYSIKENEITEKTFEAEFSDVSPVIIAHSHSIEVDQFNYDVMRFSVGNILLLFGGMQIGISFITLYKIFF